jgi:hypothetical protein
MSNPFTDNATPIDPATAAANAITAMSRRTFRDCAAAHRRLFDLFWNNPRATPQEIAAALGTSALALFTAHAALGAAIEAAVPGTVTYAPPRAYTVNPDGSLTVGDPVTPLSEHPGA